MCVCQCSYMCNIITMNAQLLINTIVLTNTIYNVHIRIMYTVILYIVPYRVPYI